MLKQGIIAGILIAVAAPTAAAQAQTHPAPANGPEQSIRAKIERLEPVFRRVDALTAAGKHDQALREFTRAERDNRDPFLKNFLSVFRVVLLSNAGRDGEAEALFDSVAAADPNSPVVPMLGFGLFRQSGKPLLAVRALDRLIAVHPEIARNLPKDDVFELLRALVVLKRLDVSKPLRVRLGRIGYGGEDGPVRDSFSWSVARDALDRGDIQAANAAVATIDDLRTLRAILTDRRYAALWPALEARVGPRLEQPRTAAMLIAQRLAAEAPDDLERKRIYFDTLVDAGQKADADKLAAEVGKTPDDIKKLDEQGGWLINNHAGLLIDMGKLDAGDARYASLRALDIAQAPWIINMVINRAIDQAERGDVARAKPLLDEAATLSKTYGSAYARAIVDAARVCAAARGADPGGAESLLPAVLAQADAAKLAAIGALMCAGNTDEAATRIIAMLADEDERDDAIRRLLEKIPPPPMGIRNPGELPQLLARPDVRAAFDKVARELPPALRYD